MKAFPVAREAGNEVMDAYTIRDELANSALHAADESLAGVWCNWVVPVASLFSVAKASGPIVTDTPTASLTEWYPLTCDGPFDLPIWEDATPYKLRVRLRGATASAGTAVTFGITIGPNEGAVGITYTADLGGTGTARALFNATTSATRAWLTPSSGSDLVTLTTEQIAFARSRSPRRTFDTLDTSSGVAVPVRCTPVYVRVWAKAAATGPQLAQLSGLHVALYVG